MDLGKPLKTVQIPAEQPQRRPQELPRRHDDGELIPLPDNWPKRSPVEVPEKAADWSDR